MSVAIIGTAGRKEDGEKLNLQKFDTMLLKSLGEILRLTTVYNLNNINLVSGGSAYADHIAVKLFLEELPHVLPPLNLTLYLPDYFVNGEFVDRGSGDWKTNPGKTLNYYHQLFQDKTGIKSLDQIENAIQKGAKVHIVPGLFERNTKVSETDSLIAFTFGNGRYVKPGGTSDTVSKYEKRVRSKNLPNLSCHVDLNNMTIYYPAVS